MGTFDRETPGMFRGSCRARSAGRDAGSRDIAAAARIHLSATTKAVTSCRRQSATVDGVARVAGQAGTRQLHSVPAAARAPAISAAAVTASGGIAAGSPPASHLGATAPAASQVVARHRGSLFLTRFFAATLSTSGLTATALAAALPPASILTAAGILSSGLAAGLTARALPARLSTAGLTA